MTALLVDDDDFARNAFVSVLEKFFPVRTAASCREALEMIEDQLPFVALLDVRLPDGSGIELATRLRTSSPYARFSLITANVNDDLMREGAMLDAITIPKPPLDVLTHFATANAEAAWLDHRGREAGLSDRELELVLSRARGETLEAFVAAVGITEQTARTYRRRVREKAGMAPEEFVEAVRAWRRENAGRPER